MPNTYKINYMDMKYTKSFHSRAFKKLKNGFFGTKIYHLATLVPTFSMRNLLVLCFLTGVDVMKKYFLVTIFSRKICDTKSL
jgi:hypothetical protein